MIKLGIFVWMMWLFFVRYDLFGSIIEYVSPIIVQILIIATSCVFLYMLINMRMIFHYLAMKDFSSTKTILVEEYNEAKNGLKNRQIKRKIERSKDDRTKQIISKHLQSFNYRRLFWFLVLRAYIVCGVLFILASMSAIIIMMIALVIASGKIFKLAKGIYNGFKEFVMWFIGLAKI
ncbi:hypothetical protein [Laceyella putida]